MKKLGKYSFGMGDRFGRQGVAQLRAVLEAKKEGLNITPVWNKSWREHRTLNTRPEEVRQEADEATRVLDWQGDYFVDADHIGLQNVDEFTGASDFFTIDVADYIGKAPEKEELNAFMEENKLNLGKLFIPGIPEPFSVDEALLNSLAANYLAACKQAGNIYTHIQAKKGFESFVTEVSMDEVDKPQSPLELFFILKMLAFYSVPLQTIAPKFSGNFYKGIDYEGDVSQFAKEFEEDILVIDYAVKSFGLPAELKLSVHSGSDKFSLYQPIRELLQKHQAGIHIKTAGTSWLEELAALAQAGEKELKLAKSIYSQALERYEELTSPYKSVLKIEKDKLPPAGEVSSWSGSRFAESLRHDQQNPHYNLHFRQLLHCAYKIAGEEGESFTNALEAHSQLTGRHVTENLWERHIKPLFIGQQKSTKA